MATKRRELNGRLGIFVTVLGVLITAFHIWFNSFGLIAITTKNAIHVGSLLGLGFLLYPAHSKSPKEQPSVIDWVLFSLCNGCALYILVSYNRIIESMLNPNTWDYCYGIVFLILIVEASRRFVGVLITCIALCFLLYTYLGPYMPSFFAHQGFTLKRILIRMTMTNCYVARPLT